MKKSKCVGRESVNKKETVYVIMYFTDDFTDELRWSLYEDDLVVYASYKAAYRAATKLLKKWDWEIHELQCGK